LLTIKLSRQCSTRHQKECGKYSTVQFIEHVPAMAPATELATVPARLERVVNMAYDAPVVVWDVLV
jgi:hypothetical protein